MSHLSEARAIYERGISAGGQFSIVDEIATALATVERETEQRVRDEVANEIRQECADRIEQLEKEREDISFELLDAMRARIAELERERDDWFQATKNALEAGTIVPAPEPTRKTSQRDNWHYDSDGYCDNPGRGY